MSSFSRAKRGGRIDEWWKESRILSKVGKSALGVWREGDDGLAGREGGGKSIKN